MDRKNFSLFFILVTAAILIFVLIFSGSLPVGLANRQILPAPEQKESPAILANSSNAVSVLTSAPPALVYSTLADDTLGCPVLLTKPVDRFACPRDLPAVPALYRPADPRSPTQAEMDAIPVNFPGLDRNLLVRVALKDPCVIEFLTSGGDIEGITDQPRPTAGRESVRWPPTLMGYRRINCTEMLVLFDLDPSAGNVSRIRVDFR